MILLSGIIKTLFPKQLATFVYKLSKRTQQSEGIYMPNYFLCINLPLLNYSYLIIVKDNDLNSKVQFVVKYRSLKDGMYYFGYSIMLYNRI